MLAKLASKTPASVMVVLSGTVVSAASSFIVLVIVAPALGPAEFSSFSVYWGALFMIVAVLFGMQQEVTRGVASAQSSTSRRIEASSRTPGGPRSVSTLTFAMVVAVTVLLAISSTGMFWGEALFGATSRGWTLPLAVAVGSYAIVATTNGILAGTSRWGAFSLLAVLDGSLRLLFVALALGMNWGNLALVWAVALPFPISLAVVYFGNRRAIHTHARIDGTFRQLGSHTARTLTASLSSGILINGFPVFLSAFARTDAATLGAVILAVTLTRAPILVPLTALQSMLIARLSQLSSGRKRALLLVIFALVALTALVALLVWAVGAPLIGYIFGEGFVLSSLVLAGLVTSAGCLGILSATGAAALANGSHSIFALGWFIAAAGSIALLALLPFELDVRVIIALFFGPISGAGVHLVAVLKTPTPVR